LKLALGIVDRLVVLGGVDIERSGGATQTKASAARPRAKRKKAGIRFGKKTSDALEYAGERGKVRGARL